MPGSDYIRSVLKAMDVLELVGHSVDGMQLCYLQTLLKQNKTTLHTLLRTLASRGYLVKLMNPVRYVLGPAASSIDRQNVDHNRFGQVGHLMMSMSRESGMQITFQQLVGHKVYVLLRVTPETDLCVERRDWFSYAYGTSVIFQAYQTKKEQDIYWRENPMDDLARKLWGDLGNLRKYLKLAAEQKLAIIDTKYDQKLRISAPIFDADGKMTAAIAAYQFCSQITPDQSKLAVQLIHSAGRMLSAPARISPAGKIRK